MDVKNTKDLQLMALDSYLYELGYARKSISNLTFTRFSGEVANDPEENISFNTAVRLYNTKWGFYDHFNIYHPQLNTSWPLGIGATLMIILDPYAFTKLQSRKIVEKVFLQAKKNKQIVVQKHQVKFVNEHYYDLFLGD